MRCHHALGVIRLLFAFLPQLWKLAIIIVPPHCATVFTESVMEELHMLFQQTAERMHLSATTKQTAWQTYSQVHSLNPSMHQVRTFNSLEGSL